MKNCTEKNKEKPLWRVQREAVEFAMKNEAVMLNMAMGTGKTRVAVEVMNRLGARRVLVIAPKSVVPVWEGEVRKFSPKRSWNVFEFGSGSVKKRAERIENIVGDTDIENAIIVLNYDVVWRDSLKKILMKTDWDIVILDESHRAKSHKSKTSRACYMIGRDAPRRICLSGTPMANSPLDVFGQYRFLDTDIYGRWWTPFINEYAVLGGPERNFIVGYRNLDRLGRKFNSIAYTCTKDDIKEEANLVDPPDSLTRIGYLTGEARKIYNDLRRDFVAEHKQGIITAHNVLVRMLRFQQLTSGFIETTDIDGRNPRIREISNTKINMLKELLEDLPVEEPLVLFYKFRKDAERIRGAVVDREVFEMSGDRNELEEWKASKNGLLVAQYQSGSEGISLVKSSYIIYYSGTFSLSEYQQSQSRVYRPGQTRPVTLIHLIIQGTIDQTVMDALESKRDVIQQVLETGRV